MHYTHRRRLPEPQPVGGIGRSWSDITSCLNTRQCCCGVLLYAFTSEHSRTAVSLKNKVGGLSGSQPALSLVSCHWRPWDLVLSLGLIAFNRRKLATIGFSFLGFWAGPQSEAMVDWESARSSMRKHASSGAYKRPRTYGF